VSGVSCVEGGVVDLRRSVQGHVMAERSARRPEDKLLHCLFYVHKENMSDDAPERS
jgi:hypothetical protein